MDRRSAAALYQAYLLRCWREHGLDAGSAGAWRFSLEEPRTGVRRGFSSLAALVAFLERALPAEPPAPADLAAPSGGGGPGEAPSSDAALAPA